MSEKETEERIELPSFSALILASCINSVLSESRAGNQSVRSIFESNEDSILLGYIKEITLSPIDLAKQYGARNSSELLTLTTELKKEL